MRAASGAGGFPQQQQPQPSQPFYGSPEAEVQANVLQIAATLEKAVRDANDGLKRAADAGRIMYSSVEALRLVGKFAPGQG